MAGRLRSLTDALGDETRRAAAAQEVARELGAKQLLLLVEDPELRVLLPAPGMPKTIAGGPAWRALLQRCRAEARLQAEVDLDGVTARAAAVVEDGCAFVLVGAGGLEFPEAFVSCTPLLAAVLRAQQSLRVGMAQAAQAREAAARAHELAAALDSARAAAADLNRQLQLEHQRKDEFLAMLAHELRNPLAPMTTAIEILKRLDPPDPRTDRHLGVMSRQLQQLTHLVDDLLDVSRVSRGLIELRREVLRLGEVLTAAVDSSRPSIDSRRHTLALELAEPDLFVSGDRVRLVQVFSNLLNNAAKYTEPGGRLELSARREGDKILVRVADNGVGIPRELLTGIFDMFAQVPGSLDRAPGGLGIGLTLVRTLVQLHDGRVHAESDGPGTGSTFVVSLPLAQAPTESERDEAPPRADMSKAQVMVVDDNVDAAESLAEILRLLGAGVQVAHDGAQALMLAAAGQPDLVLLDIGLPGIDGYETAREWRRRFGGGTRLVALTGYGSADDKRRTAQAGFDGHLVKPVALDALQQLLERVEQPG